MKIYRLTICLLFIAGLAASFLLDPWVGRGGTFLAGFAFAQMFPTAGFFRMHGVMEPWQ